MFGYHFVSNPSAANPVFNVTFARVGPTDFDELALLRIAAMRESLERVGRFNPERARERLRNSFYPEHTYFIVLAVEKIGFYTLRPCATGLYLDHLYIHPRHQSKGIGGHVVKILIKEASTQHQAIRLGALRESESNQFYQRHGFKKEREDEWDIYYVRQP